MTGSVASLGGILGDTVFGEKGDSVNLGFDELGPLRYTVQVTGMSQLVRNWEKISDAIKQQASQFTLVSAMNILHESQDEVPVKTGRLKSVGYVESSSEDDKNRPRLFDIGYDLDRSELSGFPIPEEDYARKQHDDLELEHPHGGKAHFLLDPFTRWEEKYPTGLSDELTQAVAREVASLTVTAPGGGPRLVKRKG